MACSHGLYERGDTNGTQDPDWLYLAICEEFTPDEQRHAKAKLEEAGFAVEFEGVSKHHVQNFRIKIGPEFANRGRAKKLVRLGIYAAVRETGRKIPSDEELERDA